jgi:hypothetical protein
VKSYMIVLPFYLPLTSKNYSCLSAWYHAFYFTYPWYCIGHNIFYSHIYATPWKVVSDFSSSTQPVFLQHWIDFAFLSWAPIEEGRADSHWGTTWYVCTQGKSPDPHSAWCNYYSMSSHMD